MKTEYNKNKGNRLAGLMKEGEKLITNSSPITKKNSILKMKKEKKLIIKEIIQILVREL